MFRNLEAEQARKGWTDEQVSEKLGISRTSYGQKKKHGKFYVYEIFKLCEIFESDFNYLFETEKKTA